jgi:hypothetical protein
MSTDCPVCNGSDRPPLWWSKAGMTYRLCEPHKEAARSQRRLRYEFDQIRRKAFTLVQMDETRRQT